MVQTVRNGRIVSGQQRQTRSTSAPASSRTRSIASTSAASSSRRSRSVSASSRSTTTSTVKNPYNNKKKNPPVATSPPVTANGKGKKRTCHTAPPEPVEQEDVVAPVLDRGVLLVVDTTTTTAAAASVTAVDLPPAVAVATTTTATIAPIFTESESTIPDPTPESPEPGDPVGDVAEGIVVAELVLPPTASAIPVLPNTGGAVVTLPQAAAAAATPQFTLASILKAMRDNPLALGKDTDKISALTFNSKLHEKRKNKYVDEFFHSLATHPTLAPLTEVVPDPEAPTVKTFWFYILCRAPVNPNKKALLNYCLLVHSPHVVQVSYRNTDLTKDIKLWAEAQYQSTVVGVRFRSLFANFKENGITYSLGNDFNEPGGFQAYWSFVFETTKSIKSSYDTVPNRACFDEEWFDKRWAAIQDPKNPLDPLNNLEHYVWCAMENIMVEWATRGCVESTSLVKEDFEFGTIKEGEYAGIPFVQLKPNYNGQKQNKLTLKKTSLDDRNCKKRTLPCPYDWHPMSCYQTTCTLLNMVPDNCDGVNRIFRKPASQKQIEKWKKEGKPWCLNPNSSKVIGKHKVNSFLKQIARWSNYDNAERCTAHGKRHEGISKVANASVCPSLVKGLGGHAHIDTTTNYIKPNQQAIDAAVRAKHGPALKLREQAKVPPPPPPALSPPEKSPAAAAAAAATSPFDLLFFDPAPNAADDSSPLQSVHHDFGDSPLASLDGSKNSCSSDKAAGDLGMMTQKFDIPEESPPPPPPPALLPFHWMFHFLPP